MKLQRGLTLIEMVIAISLLAIMISAIVFSFDGSKSRAQILIAAMEEYTGALERMKTDTSCYPRSLVALIDRAEAVGGANSFCGADLSLQWNGPYVKAAATRNDGTEKILMAQISPDLMLSIGRTDSVFGGGGPATNKWFIVAQNVPSEIVSQAMAVCNGVDSEVNTTAVSAGIRKCAKDTDTVAEVGYDPSALNLATNPIADLRSFAMLFAESRR